ncbi:hypothetical protein N7509_010081 [Penicillium cosmopolitanum]|uniref:Transcription factor domain-containing protein n=1 Tax=Penicillium cosmopolitanum TaxID=1131564 RepID=A0A9W9VQV4_9EURO|nr:uncharacterized protein N7509_010081 [Penicillium cosmopolitanum]KAJ5387540.1 hypothetical protein N7509_010081 [Penicillium cosmopolitanum]
MTCVNASREILSRFLMFRGFNSNNFCCRTVDFFALMAAITLLLAHLDGHRFLQTSNLLAHQYLSDRAMIEQAQVNMERISRLNGDNLSSQSASLLHSLLVIDSDSADGFSTESVRVQTPESPAWQSSESGNVVQVQIPYFGIVSIARGGIALRKTSNAQSSAIDDQPYAPVGGMHNSEISEAGVGDLSSGHFDEDAFSRSKNNPNYNSFDTITSPPAQLASRCQETVSTSLWQNTLDPVLTAGVDDWAFQGVDMAFFDSMMRGFDNRNISEAWENTP